MKILVMLCMLTLTQFSWCMKRLSLSEKSDIDFKKLHNECLKKDIINSLKKPRIVTLSNENLQEVTINANYGTSIRFLEHLVRDSKLDTPQTKAGIALKETGKIEIEIHLANEELAAFPYLLEYKHAVTRKKQHEALFNFSQKLLPNEITKEKSFMLAFKSVLL